jgi:hypothetical protein
MRWRTLLAAFLLIVALALLAGAALVMPSETEAELEARMEKERNPAKKAKEGARLARLKLREAIAAYEEREAERGARLVSAYLGRIRDTWQRLRSSGRNAAADQRGFKELEFELRDDERMLSDLERRVPYDERNPVEKAEKEVERVRVEVMQALFPSARGPEVKKPSGPTP